MSLWHHEAANRPGRRREREKGEPRVEKRKPYTRPQERKHQAEILRCQEVSAKKRVKELLFVFSNGNPWGYYRA
ncbi:hypothetical protein ATANTOWER_009350 [Ataeniobius toweri]|uniref:Uncharacterized protein n=1 Tax=Ataeniobius toweri TaxID=208326 RepID=A0ABU7AJB7_9TELE|nr:hypothetical protein [Ataeniobius toweri]